MMTVNWIGIGIGALKNSYPRGAHHILRPTP
jgi:hypothetical protein